VEEREERKHGGQGRSSLSSSGGVTVTLSSSGGGTVGKAAPTGPPTALFTKKRSHVRSPALPTGLPRS